MKKKAPSTPDRPAVALRRFVRLFVWISRKACAHRFDYDDLTGRTTPHDPVQWPCWKCGRVFVAHCGLDVLKHGKVQKKPNDKLTDRRA